MTNTNPTTPMTAKDRVFGSTELVEQILLELPIVDILVNATRVSRSFKNTIDGSCALQRALFFKPLAGPTSRISDEPPAILYGRTLVLEKQDDLDEVVVYRNPLDLKVHNIVTTYSQYITGQRQVKDHHFSVPAALRDNASWRKMLRCQPPPSHLSFGPTSLVTESCVYRGPLEVPNAVRSADGTLSTDGFLPVSVTSKNVVRLQRRQARYLWTMRRVSIAKDVKWIVL